MFRVSWHPSSGRHKIVTTASGTGMVLGQQPSAAWLKGHAGGRLLP